MVSSSLHVLHAGFFCLAQFDCMVFLQKENASTNIKTINNPINKGCKCSRWDISLTFSDLSRGRGEGELSQHKALVAVDSTAKWSVDLDCSSCLCYRVTASRVCSSCSIDWTWRWDGRRSTVQLRGRVALDPQCPWPAVRIVRLAHPGFGLGQKLEHFPAYSSPAFVYVLGFS